MPYNETNINLKHLPDIQRDENHSYWCTEKIVTTTVVHHHLDINSSIHDGEKWFSTLMSLCRLSNKNNSTYHRLTIHLSTTGGCMFATSKIIEAINNADIEIDLNVSGKCMSGGTMIAFGGKFNRIQIDPDTMFLFHTASTSRDNQKLNESLDYLAFINALIKSLNDKSVVKVLTPDEMEELYHGRELYMLGSEVIKRYEQYLKNNEENTGSKS